jgi:hypothetical protein
MGTLRVRPIPPTEEVFRQFPGIVIHGHAVCYDLKVDAAASKDTIEWELGSNVFVNSQGTDLKTFSAAAEYCNLTHEDVFVFHLVLSKIK